MDGELVQLATIYDSPGLLLLASTPQDERIGCIGFKSLGWVNGKLSGELRRLFVRERYRNYGAGQALAERVISHAHGNGFDRIVLNTLPEMTSAHTLYKKLGFTPSEPHVEDPAEGTLYFSRELTAV